MQIRRVLYRGAEWLEGFARRLKHRLGPTERRHAMSTAESISSIPDWP